MQKITCSAVTRQDVFRRAHELRNLNKGSTHSRRFGFWLAMAWDEARTGQTQSWLWLSDANMLAYLDNEIFGARVAFDYARMDSLNAQRSAILARQAPAQQLAA